MKSFLLLVVATILLGVLCVAAFENKINTITKDLILKTQKELDRNKIYGLDVSLLGKGYKTQSVVVLSGTLLSDEDKKKALKITKNIPGIFGVKDDIKVAQTQIIKKKLVFEPVEDNLKVDDSKNKNIKIGDIKNDINKNLSVDFSLEGVAK